MKQLTAFLRLIRWPNLVFIALTQCLFHYAVVVPSASGEVYNFPLYVNTRYFWVLCFSSVLIAAAGYIINDYFDINIDLINKPAKNVVDRQISRRWALFWHMGLSVTGLALGAWLGWAIQNPIIPLAHLVCIILLWFYSTNFKRRMLIGNVVISALTAWVIMVQLVAELPGWWSGSINNAVERFTVARLSRIGMLYAAFAFIISLIREVVKDMEDVEGDRRNGCRTMPIVMGMPASKMFVAVWLIILVGALVATQFYVIQFSWWWSAGYIIVAVVVPLIGLLGKLSNANTTSDFAQLSKRVKLVMFTGIMSMLFFIYYTR